MATRADVGLPKATILANHFHKIFPEVTVVPVVAMYTRATEDQVLGGQPPDMVIDAIDNLDTKVHFELSTVLRFCVTEFKGAWGCRQN